MQEKLAPFRLRLWRGLRRAMKTFLEEMRHSGSRTPRAAVDSLPMKYAAHLPALFALGLSATVLIGGEPWAVGWGGPAFFSFFIVPFLLVAGLFLRQQRIIDELRQRLDGKAPDDSMT